MGKKYVFRAKIMKHKKGLIVFTVLFSVAVFLATFLMIWFWGDTYTDFDGSTFREEVKIPGLKDGACPQGLATCRHTLYNSNGEKQFVKDKDGKDTSTARTQDYYFISAYFKDKPSRIYVTGKDSGYLGYVTMKYDEKPFYGHCGGVATNGTVLWVASESAVYVAKRSETSYTDVADEIILKATKNGEIEFSTSFGINGGASFVSYYKSATTSMERLYVGEFYRAGNYDSPENHHVKLPDGSGTQRAFMYEYNVSSSTEYGLSVLSNDDGKMSREVPKVQKVFSIPDRIQGIARVSGNQSERGDTIVLSQSYGLPNSNILLYDFKTIEDSGNRISYNDIDKNGFEYAGVTVSTTGRPYTVNDMYVYYVYGGRYSETEDKDGNKLFPSFYRSYSIPSMAEGLSVGTNGRVNILFESGAKKYKAFVRQSLDEVYSFMPPKH